MLAVVQLSSQTLSLSGLDDMYIDHRYAVLPAIQLYICKNFQHGEIDNQ